MGFAAPRFLAREPKAGLRAAALGFAIWRLHINLHQTPLLLSKCSSPLHADKQWAQGQTAIQAHASQNDLMPSEQHTCSQKTFTRSQFPEISYLFPAVVLVPDSHCLSSMLTQSTNGTAHHAFQRVRFAALCWAAWHAIRGHCVAALSFACLTPHSNIHAVTQPGQRQPRSMVLVIHDLSSP